MAVYYISVCHDCKEKVMWEKVTEKTAKEWHEKFHTGHDTLMGNDMDDDFYYSIGHYKHLGIQDGDEWELASKV